ncbi:MAG: hypothetical protein MJ161_05515 [Clostridia bacterium]|nr:hypothetical protein [Clostridia bacterium]
MKQIISVEAFEKSIRTALSLSFDYEAACRRVQGWLNSIPEGKLYVRRDRGFYAFYEKDVKRHQIYLSKSSDRLYALARRKYLQNLYEILSVIHLHNSPASTFSEWSSYSELDSLIDNLIKLVVAFASGNLDLARIVMTPAQYKWYTSSFAQKKINLSEARFTDNGVAVRSKSEQDIGNVSEEYAAFYHYEERIKINVRNLVNSLRESLESANWPTGELYYYDKYGCHWKVPEVLEWMNSNGSIWRAYDDRTGRITIYNDFKFMLADGTIKIWEHSGMVDKFKYRCNASEREYVMEYTETISRENYINTFEKDISTSEAIADILKEHILPRLWF